MEAGGHIIVVNCKSDSVFATDLHDFVVARMPGVELAPPHERIGAVLPGTIAGIVVSSRALGVGSADQATRAGCRPLSSRHSDRTAQHSFL